jgi:hypothetical protein
MYNNTINTISNSIVKVFTIYEMADLKQTERTHSVNEKQITRNVRRNFQISLKHNFVFLLPLKYFASNLEHAEQTYTNGWMKRVNTIPPTFISWPRYVPFCVFTYFSPVFLSSDCYHFNLFFLFFLVLLFKFILISKISIIFVRVWICSLENEWNFSAQNKMLDQSALCSIYIYFPLPKDQPPPKRKRTIIIFPIKPVTSLSLLSAARGLCQNVTMDFQFSISHSWCGD